MEHWAVTVSANGEPIVTIETRCLAGRELSPADEATIRYAARCLLAFVGPINEQPSSPRHLTRANALRDAMCSILSATGRHAHDIPRLAKEALERDNEIWDAIYIVAPPTVSAGTSREPG